MIPSIIEANERQKNYLVNVLGFLDIVREHLHFHFIFISCVLVDGFLHNTLEALCMENIFLQKKANKQNIKIFYSIIIN